ncbi:MAG: hypothetical protein ABSF98_17095 [Bryobacteraceae bacterium]|jgi:hypothetical protein
MVRRAIVRRAIERKLQRFLTLTLDPKKMQSGWGVKEKITFLHQTWRKMRVSLRRLLGKSLAFIAVVELQGNGNPHLHVLVGRFLPKQWITDAWQAVGGGWATRIEYADVHRVAAYLSKYLTDDSLSEFPPGTRRFSTSRGLALFERPDAQGAASVLVRWPIEYCWARASGITAEQYKTEQDGARSLVTFVAAQVDGAITARLHGSNGVRLWIEVGPRKSARPGTLSWGV